MRLILVILGAIAGVYIVKTFMLDTVELIGWNLFWEAVTRRVDIGADGMNVVLRSSAFAKCCIGAILGAIGARVFVAVVTTTKGS